MSQPNCNECRAVIHLATMIEEKLGPLLERHDAAINGDQGLNVRMARVEQIARALVWVCGISVAALITSGIGVALSAWLR